jgi:hypothetical protein
LDARSPGRTALLVKPFLRAPGRLQSIPRPGSQNPALRRVLVYFGLAWPEGGEPSGRSRSSRYGSHLSAGRSTPVAASTPEAPRSDVYCSRSRTAASSRMTASAPSRYSSAIMASRRRLSRSSPPTVLCSPSAWRSETRGGCSLSLCSPGYPQPGRTGTRCWVLTTCPEA